MPQAFRYLSATSGYLPMASQYVVSFARKKEKFPLNRYVQYVEAPAPSFFYYEVDRDQMVRVRGLGLHVWADGAERPLRRDNQFAHRTKQAFCVRYDWNTVVGDVALEMAQKQWDAKKVYLQGLTSQAMTGRTLNVWQGLSTATDAWAGLDSTTLWTDNAPTNVADVNALNGGAGPWNTASADEANVSYMAIRKSLLEAANRIFLQTNGAVEWKDLRLVVSPNVAKAMSNTAEIREYWKYGPFARDAVEKVGNYNVQYGLPPELYGIEVVVEDSMYLSDAPTAGMTANSTNRSFIKNDTCAVILSRPGAVDAQIGPSFSTFQVYWHGGNQLSVETFAEPIDKRTRFHVTDYYTPTATALVSGFKVNNILG